MANRKQASVADHERATEDAPSAATFMLLQEDRKSVEELRLRSAALGKVLNKSEAVRLALTAVKRLRDDELVVALGSLRKLRPGRHSD